MICTLLVSSCGPEDILTAETRTGIFGSFFDDWALETETAKLTPLLYNRWKDNCYSLTEGLTLTPIGNNLYYFYDQAPVDGTFANWHQAREFCTQRGMDLISLETLPEYTAFVTYVTKILRPIATPGSLEGYWIGLNSLGAQGAYVWPTTGTQSKYPFGWLSGEPSNPTTEFCISIQKSNALVVGFADEDCNLIFSKFVCEVESPCREVLLLRYYLLKKFDIVTDLHYELQLLNMFHNKNFDDILFNKNFNTG